MVPLRQPCRPGSEPTGWSRAWPAWMFAGLLGLLLAARAAEAWHIPLPQCWFRVLTGFPCAFCGGTRAMSAIAHLDFATAARLNPLVCLLGALTVGGFLVWLADRCFGTRCGGRLRGLSDWPWLWIGLAALLLNWVFLLTLARES